MCTSCLDSFLQCASSMGVFTLVEAANPRLQFYPCFQNSSPMSILLPSLCNRAGPPTTPGHRSYCGMNSALDFWQSSTLVSSPGIGVVFACFYHLLTKLPQCPLSVLEHLVDFQAQVSSIKMWNMPFVSLTDVIGSPILHHSEREPLQSTFLSYMWWPHHRKLLKMCLKGRATSINIVSFICK